jgi:hypothetical protein
VSEHHGTGGGRETAGSVSETLTGVRKGHVKMKEEESTLNIPHRSLLQKAQPTESGEAPV